MNKNKFEKLAEALAVNIKAFQSDNQFTFLISMKFSHRQHSAWSFEKRIIAGLESLDEIVLNSEGRGCRGVGGPSADCFNLTKYF